MKCPLFYNIFRMLCYKYDLVKNVSCFCRLKGSVHAYNMYTCTCNKIDQFLINNTKQEAIQMCTNVITGLFNLF